MPCPVWARGRESELASQKGFPLLLTVTAMLAAIGCGPGARGQEAGTLRVVTSLPPHADLVRRIAGDAAEVSFLVPPGADPHTFEPLPEDMRMVSTAGLYLTAGLPFEDAWLPRIQGSSPGLHVESLVEGIELLVEPGSDGSGEGALREADPHTWLSPSLMAVEARNAADAIEALAPGDSAGIEARLDSLLVDISELQSELHAELDSLRGSAFLVVHPSYGYFALEFGLRQIAIEQNGSEPTPSELARFVELARSSGAGFILASPQFGTRAAEAIASELGIPLVIHDPLEADWMQNLRQLGLDLGGETRR
jgi:zinc transport system substrate-binding protein